MAKKAPPRPLTLAEQAAALVESSIGPQKASINSAVAQAEADRIALAKATEGITKVLGSLSAGDAAMIRDTYAGSADRIRGLGSELTGAVRAASERSAGDAGQLIRTLRAPGDVLSTAPANANVSYYSGAAIPAEGLARAAADETAAAVNRRLAAGLRLADNASSANFKAGTDISGLRAKIAELEAKRPGAVLEAFTALRGVANQERATNVQIGQLQLSQAKTVWEQAIALTNMTGSLHVVKNGKLVDTGRPAPGSEANATTTRAQIAEASVAAANERARAAREASNNRTTEVQDRIDERARLGREAAAKAAAAKARGETVSPSAKNTILQGANATGLTTLDNYLDRVWANIPDTDGQREKESTEAYNARKAQAEKTYQTRLRQNYGTALAMVMNSIGPQLKIIGYTPAQVKAVAARIVGAQIAAPTSSGSPVAGR